MRDLPNLLVCGCGSGGMAMAADLALYGCRVSLYEFPDFKDNLDPIRRSGGIMLTGNTYSGKTGLARLEVITDEAEEALRDVELIMINAPAMAVDGIVAALSPYFVEGQTVVVTTGYWASLRSRELLEKGNLLEKITFVEENIMPYLSRKVGPAAAHIYNFKRDIRVSAWPATRNPGAYELLKRVYPQLILSKHVLENNLHPGNPAVHAQINIPKAEFFFERSKEFRFYGEISMCAGKLADAFDQERIMVARAFGCETITYLDWMRRAYGYEGGSLYEIFGNVTNPHTRRWTNDGGNRRVLREDLCYFFVPLEQLAEVVGIEVPVTKAIIEILRIFADFDYRAHGVGLKDLGLAGLGRDQIIEFVTHGKA
ncbi:MAG: NAD/NADP octopine/nopaline dehydrogenase family protein [Deltaproteobacteria bacterium]|nr:NAD/NADP octopine/nopaline dehydrogenase family protein [Deltaproteobacteria bacterium]MBW2120990.1 NAD/NADP octopine/nopaline dehydrogenase family protein [Deltaproteobacteria bacterium]